eukprot:TRINITY_DN17684_c0_g1_i1.p1 TRINITY_DN17684_c0_g1~~TRINITY_DN17684_c0_g1_i1.p1  ORF type:complete len:284 (+),score=53.93 TRINITY_DN17684_c0_g1_i1:24-854(+)
MLGFVRRRVSPWSLYHSSTLGSTLPPRRALHAPRTLPPRGPGQEPESEDGEEFAHLRKKVADFKVTMSPAFLAKARHLFAGDVQWRYLEDPKAIEGEPTDYPEICFVGRSNVGKSSLVNKLLGRTVARVSKTPGRTQGIHFYQVRNRVNIVDLPGFGYAQVNQHNKKRINSILQTYVHSRPPDILKLICVLFDARRLFDKEDEAILKSLDDTQKVYMIILTKIDKVPTKQIPALVAEMERITQSHGKCLPEVIPTSSVYDIGFDRLRGTILGSIEY